MTSRADTTDDEAGMAVARAAVGRAAAAFGPRLVSAYAIGSLAHGGFAPAVSDVDVALLVDRCDAGVAGTVEAAVAHTRSQLGPGLADRLSVFYGDWPTRDELLEETARFVAGRPAQPPPSTELVASGPRALTKTVLFPVRFLHTHATGRAGANEDAAEWYRDAGRPHVALVDAALRWRHDSVPATDAIRLLDEHMPGLYEECRRAFG